MGREMAFSGRIAATGPTLVTNAAGRIPSDKQVVLEVKGLSVEIGGSGSEPQRVVDDVSFDVRSGEMLGIVGGSGAGKTTLFRAVLGYLPRTARVVCGEVRYRGVDLVAQSERQMSRLRGRELAIIVQNPVAALNPLRRVGRQMKDIARHQGVALDDIRLTAHLLGAGIPEPDRVAHAYPHELSGGLAQRVLIAMAVALQPRVILADEPTSALDVTIQAQIMDLLWTLTAQDGIAVVCVTHDIALIAEYGDRVVVLANGRVVEQGDVEQVIFHPAQRYTRDLIASAQVSLPK